jgi:hypothetical protein
MIMKNSPITLIATGSLTNIAVLLTVYPEVVDHIDQLVLMGGAIVVHNYPIIENLHIPLGNWKYDTSSRMEHNASKVKE